MKTRLHIFLGAGGVGKTTLSASLAIHLAFQGRRVGLLSIDPARRLKTALGAPHIDESGQIFWKSNTGEGELRAAVLSLPDSLRRWIRDEGLGGDHEQRLFEHPLFQTVAEKIASATETLAPIRMAEWIEQYPDTDDLIIDTAPGLHAVDFLIRPERLLAFFDSRILEWLQWFAGKEENTGLIQRVFRSGAKSILHALGRVGGENILLSLGELLLMMDRVMLRMVDRLEEARAWIRDPQTDIVLVCSPRDDAVAVASELARILSVNGIRDSRIILNRSIPESFFADKEVQSLFATADFPASDFDALFCQYLQSAAKIQESVMQRIGDHVVTELPVLAGLEQAGELRLEELERMGARLNDIRIYRT
jgi:anion-transporting  ArsA/GET3 family ATPase